MTRAEECRHEFFFKIQAHSDVEHQVRRENSEELHSLFLTTEFTNQFGKKKYRLAIRPQKYFKDLDLMNERMNQSL